jgi:cytochrome c oxidase subunit 1/cytochrome c oxidase subunit I+III
MAITIPSGVSFFAWVATIWYGKPVYSSPMLFMLGFLAVFVIGGVTGVMTAVVPLDWQLTDTYFIVGHLHYTLIGWNLFPIVGAFVYWFPKFTGRMLSERLAKVSFWVMFVGFNVAFFPMHVLGFLGMPRRVFTYAEGLGWEAGNMVVTIGAFAFGIGILMLAVGALWSLSRGALAGPDPWGAGTLEWAASSPPPPYNFEVIPTVDSREPLWEDGNIFDRGPTMHEHHHEVLGTSVLDAAPETVLEMPGHSLAPLSVALALTLLFYGALWNIWWLAGTGFAWLVASIAWWLWPDGHGQR